MGLEDLVPDDVDTGTSSSSTPRKPRKKTPEENPEMVVIGGGPNKKVFHEDDWENVKRVIRDEMGLQVNVVLNSPASERFEIIHEAALVAHGEKNAEELSNWSPNRCSYCGNAVDNIDVELAGHKFCVHHTIGQLQEYLEEEILEKA